MDKEKVGAAEGRSEEEVAWDKEFNEEKPMGFAASVVDIAKLAVKVPVAILQMPLSIIPEEAAHHTRAAVRESFLAFRSLLGAIGDGIESMLSDPEQKPATVSGPEGTWGTGRSSGSSGSTANAESMGFAGSTGGRARRIEWSKEDEAYTSEGEAGNGATEEGRGLRADIDY